MKTLASILAAVSLAAVSAFAVTVPAAKVGGDLSSLTPASGEWAGAKEVMVTLYPQMTVKSVDKKAAASMESAAPLVAKVKALVSDDKVAFLISYEDDEASMQGETSDRFADGIAVQFAASYKAGAPLPYIGMGSEGRPVAIHLQKYALPTYAPKSDVDYHLRGNSKNLFGEELEAYNAAVAKMADSDYQKYFIAEGFRSMTEVPDMHDAFKAQMEFNKPGFFGKLFGGKSGWKALFVRDLKDDYVDLTGDAMPVAFAIWDGKQAQRDGQKWLSGWVAVEKKAGSDLAKMIDAPVAGDPVKGKELAMANCASCHQYKETKMEGIAPFMAPNLSYVGGQATAAYIKESMMEPSAVVIPGYNRNAHPAYMWYTVMDGKRESTMPPFNYLSEEEITDLVAFFKTMK